MAYCKTGNNVQYDKLLRKSKPGRLPGYSLIKCSLLFSPMFKFCMESMYFTS